MGVDDVDGSQLREAIVVLEGGVHGLHWGVVVSVTTKYVKWDQKLSCGWHELHLLEADGFDARGHAQREKRGGAKIILSHLYQKFNYNTFNGHSIYL